LDNKIEEAKKELKIDIHNLRIEFKENISEINQRVIDIEKTLRQEILGMSIKVDQMNKRIDDLFFQYEYKMNNIQLEYKRYIINISREINKELNEYVNNRLKEELNKMMNNENDEEYKKNIKFQVKLTEIIKNAIDEYYKKAS